MFAVLPPLARREHGLISARGRVQFILARALTRRWGGDSLPLNGPRHSLGRSGENPATMPESALLRNRKPNSRSARV